MRPINCNLIRVIIEWIKWIVYIWVNNFLLLRLIIRFIRYVRLIKFWLTSIDRGMRSDQQRRCELQAMRIPVCIVGQHLQESQRPVPILESIHRGLH